MADFRGHSSLPRHRKNRAASTEAAWVRTLGRVRVGYRSRDEGSSYQSTENLGRLRQKASREAGKPALVFERRLAGIR